MSGKKCTTPTTTDSLSSSIKWYGHANFCLVIKGSCLKQNKNPPKSNNNKNATYTPPNRINFFIVYKLDTWSRDLNSDFPLKGCLFGGIKLAKNADLDKYIYSGYSIRFNSRSKFSVPDGGLGKNVIIFGVDINSSVHIDIKGKDIVIFGKGSTQGLDDTTLTAEAQYSITSL